VKMLEATTLSRAVHGNPVVVRMLCVKRMRASDHAASMLRIHIIQTAPKKLAVVLVCRNNSPSSLKNRHIRRRNGRTLAFNHW
jgi:hypothetical protein